MNSSTERFVEQMGLILESEHFPRIAGRLLGLIIASDEPRTLDDLAEDLGVSKASISTNARTLADKGIVRRVSLPGDRRDLYAAVADMGMYMLQARQAKMQRVRDVLIEGRDTIASKHRTVRDRLDDMVFTHELAFDATAKLIESLPQKLAQRRAQRGKG